MPSNINPSLEPTKSLVNFRFWCQKVLPLVYDDSLSYYEVLGKMVVQLNDVIDDVNADIENVDTLKEAFLALQTYVNEFFADINQLASYAERAEAAQTAANTSAINAASSASNASASSLAAMNAKDAAVTAQQAAETSANTASTAATNANTKASEAAQSAITAQTAQASASQSATLAATDRSAAQTAASTATTKANEASTSASNAAQSAENATQRAEDAESAAESVENSAQQIATNTSDIVILKESTAQLSNDNIIITEFVEGEYVRAADGTFAPSKPDTRTGFIKIPNDVKQLLINSPEASPYNAFYSANDNSSYISQLRYNVGETIVNVPANAHYFALSTSTAKIRNITVHGVTTYEYKAVGAQEMIARVIDSMIADTALDKNDFRIVDNTLYRIITPVESGAILTPGTNCMNTTIGAVLKSLLS